MNIRVKYIIGYSIVGLYVFITAGFVARKSAEEVCDKVEILVNDTLNRLVIPRDITKLMEDKKNSIYGHSFSKINKMHIAKLIVNNIALVKNVGVYRAINGTICINIEQRKPILRIINKYNQGYYIDADGYLIPLSNHWSARVLVANGDISERLWKNKAIHIDSLYSNIEVKQMKLKDLLTLANHINNDDFLNSLIEQIYVNDDEFEMIPKVGSLIIYFGTIENYVNKFFNLKTIYYKGFTNLGWQKYKAVSLKYQNQVICTKR